MANYHKRNSIRAVQWAPENAQSFEDIKKLIAENPGIGWKADNIVRNDASDNIIIRSFGMIVLRIKKYLRGAEVQGDGSSLSKTAKFSDGFEMDIRCCGGKDDSWTEAILYDDTGREVVATEPCDGFTGCWELKDEDTNTVYRVHVMTKSNLN